MKTGPVRQAAAYVALCLVAACTRQPTHSAPEAPFDVIEATIAEVQAAIRDGRTSCRFVVETYIARIKAYDKASGLNAITVVNPRAIARAGQFDAALKRGDRLGPLWCAPILVKDNFDTHDLPTTGGSEAMTDHLPPDDAFMVSKLREADAIVLAKTNMAEWAFSPRRTESSSYGITANAYALDRVPAGSSGGSASATAASFGIAALGTDTGNSIRGPSSHLALFGIRSTIGLTSRDGVIPLAFDRDIAGPMTRTVEDGARIFNVLAGYDPADPLMEDGKRAGDYTDFLDPDGLRGARIGVLRRLVDTEEADPEVLGLFERAIDDLEAAGARIVDPLEVVNMDYHLEHGGFCRSFRYDMRNYLLSLGDVAPMIDVRGVYESGRYSAYTKEAFEYFAAGPLDIAPEDEEPPCPRYLDHPDRRSYLDDVTAAMDAADVEALIYPTWTNPPAHLDKADEEYRGDNSQLVAPATGMPAASVPMGYTADGLPAGLQILARRYDEPVIFRIAYAYEQWTRHRRPPPGFGPLR